jgi:pimeloyl-ACP methyl ester carboxylesterase
MEGMMEGEIMNLDPPFCSRRQFIQAATAVILQSTLAATVRAAESDRGVEMATNPDVAYGAHTLPRGIRSRFVDNSNGLKMHVLEAGFGDNARPCVLLLHGFPELAYSWRKVMLPLANAGFYVVAPDQRGYGRTTGWDGSYDGDVASFRYVNLVRDSVGLVSALGYRSVAAVVGHDFGSPVAAWCSLIRPDVFRSVVLMSAPFAGPPALPFNSANEPARGAPPASSSIHDDLAKLPRPRKHYFWYYGTREADPNMRYANQRLHNFLRAYYHNKSADWKENNPFPLKSWTAPELAKLPTYYIMDLDKGMAETVAPEMPSLAEIEACKWLTDTELQVYADEYTRNGFQGGLQWYRCAVDQKYRPELQTYSDRTIDVPSCFIAGAKDWGIYQMPGSFEKMQTTACTRMLGVHLVEHAGHWVQQEQDAATTRLLLEFIQQAKA